MPVTVHDWPAGVPECLFPLQSSGGPRDNRLSFETDSMGPPVERPAASWAPEVYSVAVAPMSVTQFQAFQTWYKTTLAWGTQPFKLDHPITKTRMAWKIVKADPPYQVSKALPIGNGSSIRAIRVAFTIMSMPYSFPADFLAQEAADLILQEQSDRIVIRDGFEFEG